MTLDQLRKLALFYSIIKLICYYVLLLLVKHNWGTMVEAIQAHVGGLNWGYRVALREKKVQYLNAYAEFVDAHTLKVSLNFLVPSEWNRS